MDVDKLIFFFGSIGGLIFVFLILNQGGGKPATNLVTAITNGGTGLVKTLQGR